MWVPYAMQYFKRCENCNTLREVKIDAFTVQGLSFAKEKRSCFTMDKKLVMLFKSGLIINSKCLFKEIVNLPQPMEDTGKSRLALCCLNSAKQGTMFWFQVNVK